MASTPKENADATGPSPNQPATLWAARAGVQGADNEAIADAIDRSIVEDFTRGDDAELDHVLLPYDLRGTIAHVQGLGRVGLLTADEVAALTTACEALVDEHAAGDFTVGEHEDGHTAIEAALTERLGDLGKRVHTARSRNDQVLTALRLWLREQLAEVTTSADALADAFTATAERADERELSMPGFSHGQPGMPVPVSMWLTSFTDGLADDVTVLDCVRTIADQSPLGSVAGFGPPPPIVLDRAFTADAMGFPAVQDNPIYCQQSRPKFDILVLEALANLCRTVARFAADALMFTSAGYPYLRVPDRFTTGSSLMPNKRNQDVLELLRARAAQVEACAAEARGIAAATLTSGYHRDYQALKAPLMLATSLTRWELPVATALVVELDFDAAALARAVADPAIQATAEAHRLVVEQGMTFRDAYRHVKQALAGDEPPADAGPAPASS